MTSQQTQQLLRGAAAGVAIPPADGFRFTTEVASAGPPATEAAVPVDPDEVDDDEFIEQVVPLTASVVEDDVVGDDDGPDDADAWLAQQRERAGAADAVRAAGPRRPAEVDDHPEPTVRATSAGGRYDDGIPERTIEDLEREEAERRAAVGAGDVEESARIARVQSRTHSIAASIARGAKVPNENVGKPPADRAADRAPSSRARPVRCLEDNAVFGSLRQAAESLKIDQNRLRRIVDAGRKFKGKRYAFADAGATVTSVTLPVKPSRHFRPVVCVDPFKIFQTESAACEAINGRKGAIRDAIIGGHRAGGYVWRDATHEEIATHLPHLGIAAEKITKRQAKAKSKGPAAKENPAPAGRVAPAAPVQAGTSPVPPIPRPGSDASISSDTMTFVAKAMLCLGRGNAVLDDGQVGDVIEQAKRLNEARWLIGSIERGEPLVSIDVWAKAGA